MTIRNRLLIAICLVFLVAFAGMLALSVHATRNYLQQQLASHAQDAATALSYPLGQALEHDDLMLADARTSAIFDRGYYQQITVLSADKKKLIDKVMPARIEGVPLWFARLFSLETQAGEAFLSSGWRQLGKVIVISQPTIAYQHLWSSVTELCWWMLAVLLLSLGLAFLLLRTVLLPLRYIEHAAISISHKRFVQIPVLPNARELRRVVLAMNSMSHRAAENLEAEIRRAEQFRRQAYADPVTELDNRLGFDLRFDQLLEDPDKFVSAALLMLELDGVKDYNLACGYEQGDALLLGVADSAREALGRRAQIASRSGGASFAFLMLDVREPEINALWPELKRRLEANLQQYHAHDRVSFNLGCAMFGAGEGREDVLGRADLAVETARQTSRNGIAIIPARIADSQPGGSFDWRQTIRHALAQNRWSLQAQPVLAVSDRTILHHEIFCQLIDERGVKIGAAQFLPMALRHNMMTEVDQALIAWILDFLGHRTGGMKNLSLNVSAQSLASPEFRAWLIAKLRASNAQARQLAFEAGEFSVARNMDAASDFASAMRGRGASFGIDRFGLEPDSLHTLRRLVPDYIKLDGRLLRESANIPDSRAHMLAIVRLAASLDVRVIAQCIESESALTQLAEDKIAYAQGYYLGVPERI